MKARSKLGNLIVDYFIYDNNFNELREFIKDFNIIDNVEEFNDEGEIIIDIFGSEGGDDELNTTFPVLVIGNDWFNTMSLELFRRLYKSI